MPNRVVCDVAKCVCKYSMGAMVALILGAAPVRGASLVVEWDPSTARTDESALSNLAGYRIYYGEQSGVYDRVVEVGPGTRATLASLKDGVTYYIAVSAVDGFGQESQRSEEMAWNSRDTDMDQLPDLWEVDRFGSTAVSSAGNNEDSDADGMTDRAEFVAGTHPANGDSILFLDLAYVDGRPAVSFVATRAEGPGYDMGQQRMFAVECSDDMVQWHPCAGMPVAGNNQLVNQIMTDESSRLMYRLSCWLEGASL